MAVVINGTAGITAPGTETFGSGTALGGATNPIVSMAQGAAGYVQSYIINNTNGTSSSADIVAYPSNGTDSHGWVDMGITSLSYADTTYTVTGPNESYIFASAPSGSSTTGNLVIATDNTGTANSIQFYTNGFTQAKSAARMVIDGSGNVSVGYRAVVGQAAAGDSVFQVYSASYGGMRIGYNSTAVNYIDSGTLNFRNAAGSVTNAVIDSSGNLLVGDTAVGSAGCALNLKRGTTTSWQVGPSTANGTGTFFYVINAANTGVVLNSGNTSWSTNSDERLKTSLTPFENATEKVCTLRAGTGRYLTDEETVSRSFLIAQDVQKVLPEAVTTGEDEQKTLMLQYTELIPLLTAAIQEQQAIIEQLRADVEALKAK